MIARTGSAMHPADLMPHPSAASLHRNLKMALFVSNRGECPGQGRRFCLCRTCAQGLARLGTTPCPVATVL